MFRINFIILFLCMFINYGWSFKFITVSKSGEESLSSDIEVVFINKGYKVFPYSLMTKMKEQKLEDEIGIVKCESEAKKLTFRKQVNLYCKISNIKGQVYFSESLSDKGGDVSDLELELVREIFDSYPSSFGSGKYLDEKEVVLLSVVPEKKSLKKIQRRKTPLPRRRVDPMESVYSEMRVACAEFKELNEKQEFILNQIDNTPAKEYDFDIETYSRNGISSYNSRGTIKEKNNLGISLSNLVFAIAAHSNEKEMNEQKAQCVGLQQRYLSLKFQKKKQKEIAEDKKSRMQYVRDSLEAEYYLQLLIKMQEEANVQMKSDSTLIPVK